MCNPNMEAKVHELMELKRMNVSELARICGLSRPTVYKYLKMMD